MAFTKEEEILEAVNSIKKNSSEVRLRRRFEDDYDLWRLESYQYGKKGEYENYTTNEPRTVANKTIEILASAMIQARIPLELSDEPDRTRKSQTERFYHGVLNLINSRFEATRQPDLQGQLAWNAVLRGWIAVRAYMRKAKNGETIPDVAVWDLLNTYYDVGSEDILWVCHTRPITQSQANTEYGIETAGNNTSAKNTIVYDMWDEKNNTIVINGKFVKKPTTHGVDHLPVLIKMVGSTPVIQSQRFTDTLQDSGESIYASNRALYEHKNKMMTLLNTIVSLGAHNPLALYSSGGKKTFQKSPYYKGAVINFDVDKGEKVEALYKPEMPRDVAALMGNIQRDLSTGGIAPIAGGELNFQLPYSGIKELIEAARSIIKPRQQAMEEAFEWMFRELSSQYADGGFNDLRIHGANDKNEYFDMNLSSDDISGEWFPKVTLMPTLPEDDVSKHSMAKLAVDTGLMSRQTARDVYLGVQDTDAEQEKINVEMAKQLPPVQIREYVMALIKDGRPALANAIMQDYYGGMDTGAVKGGGGGGNQPVEPQFASGLPNTMVTPEQMGKRQRPPGERQQYRGDEIK